MEPTEPTTPRATPRALSRGAPGVAVAAAVAVVAALALGACATPPRATLADDAAEAPPPEDTLRQQRQVHRALSLHPLASEVRGDLDLAAGWLDRAEDLTAGDDEARARLPLLLAAIDGQLVMIKTHYDRDAAERESGVAARPLVEPRE